MNGPERIVVFTLEAQRYGMPLTTVDRVVRMVEITPLPGTPRCVRGVINVQGEIVPVIDLRQRLSLPDRAMSPDDQLLIVTVAQRKCALVTDLVIDVIECGDCFLAGAADILPDMPFLAGVAKLPDGMILIQDPEKLLTTMELHAVNDALSGEMLQP
jgi:purine-binding chemotaxis protein CheW